MIIGGSKIVRYMTGVKQTFILNAKPIDIFNNEIIKQSYKSARYSNEEMRVASANLKSSHQLPFTIDMIDKMEEMLWANGTWKKDECYKKAIFLAVATIYDTGRRISNVTHKNNKHDEDHCIRWGNVKFCLSQGDTQHTSGLIFREHFHAMNYTLSDVVSIQLSFITQKQSYVNNIVAVQPIIIDRMSTRSSSLIDKLTQWALVNANIEQEEFFTRNVEGTQKKLLRRDVISAMKLAASSCGINPDRISSHSIRRVYATNLALNENVQGGALTRAGWSVMSQVPIKHYSTPKNLKGGLSYDKLLHSQDLLLESED